MVVPYASRGVLHPHQLPRFVRKAPGAPLEAMVRWFWAASWNLADGVASEQTVLPFVSPNLAVERTGVTLHGPSSGVAVRTLSGAGWVVAANLQPAVSGALLDRPVAMRDTNRAVGAADLVTEVAGAFERIDDFTYAADVAVAALSAWIVCRVPPPSDQAIRANALLALIENDRTITTVTEAADALHVSQRTVQRVAHDYIGMSVGEIIRRSRLQRTMERIRQSSTESLADIAAANGYADHSHMAAELRANVYQTATQYRALATLRESEERHT